jgi:3-phenylpropionate/trans-cinnamate dioxygenase ferredoxin subunit
MVWHTVVGQNDLSVGGMKAIKIGKEKIVVYRLEDGFFATQSSCTHIFANLAKGEIVDGCKVQCPLHKARFDIRTGEVLDWANFPPGIQLLNVVRGEKALKTYAVRLEDENVQVELP